MKGENIFIPLFPDLMMVDPIITSVTESAKDIMIVIFVIIGLLILIAVIKWIQELTSRGTEVRVYRQSE